MHATELKRSLILAALLLLFSTATVAVDVDELSWVETREKWGQVLFCQKIYKMPEVKTRLYGFDIKDCDKAGRLIADGVTRYSEQEQVMLKNQAEKHATLLGLNTLEPYQSVTACREYCRELSEVQDARSD